MSDTVYISEADAVEFGHKLDAAIQDWTRRMDEAAEKAIGEPERTRSTELVTDCETTKALIPVSTGLKAVHLGALKVVLRVIPRMATEFITTEVVEASGKVLSGIVAGKIIQGIPMVGTLFNIVIGSVTEMDYMDDLEEAIHGVLGCEPSKVDSEPLRFELNELVKAMQRRVAHEARKTKKVSTRKRDKGGEDT